MYYHYYRGIWIFLSIVYSLAVHGSVIKLESTPENVHPYCTPLLNLRCSMSESSTPVSRSLTIIPAAMMYMTSLVVTRNGRPVASVTEHFPARAFLDSDNISVNGSLAGNGGEQGYMAMTWAQPSPAQNGTYTCEAHGLDDIGRGVVFTAVAEVLVEGHPADELIKNLTAKVKDLEATVQKLKMNTPTTAPPPLTAAQSILRSNGTVCPPNTVMTGPEMTSLIRVGSRMVRGTDWHSNWHTDAESIGDPPGPGTVYEVYNGQLTGMIGVAWDKYDHSYHGLNTFMYRMGKDNKYEIKFACMV